MNRPETLADAIAILMRVGVSFEKALVVAQSPDVGRYLAMAAVLERPVPAALSEVSVAMPLATLRAHLREQPMDTESD